MTFADSEDSDESEESGEESSEPVSDDSNDLGKPQYEFKKNKVISINSSFLDYRLNHQILSFNRLKNQTRRKPNKILAKKTKIAMKATTVISKKKNRAPKKANPNLVNRLKNQRNRPNRIPARQKNPAISIFYWN